MRLFFTLFFLNGIFIITFSLMLPAVIEQVAMSIVTSTVVPILFAFFSIAGIINSVNATIF